MITQERIQDLIERGIGVEPVEGGYRWVNHSADGEFVEPNPTVATEQMAWVGADAYVRDVVGE